MFKSIGRRWAYRLVFLFVCLEVLYVIAANVLLNTPILQNLIDSTRSEIKIDYQYAYSFVPGYVKIKNLKFLIQDSTIQMFFSMNGTSVRVDLVSLLRREFHSTRVQGTDLSFKLRFRRSKTDAAQTKLVALPSIPEVTSIEKPTGTDSGAPLHPWHLRLDGIFISSMREFWLEEFHFTGQAALKGSFFLFPGQKLQINQSELIFDNGEVVVDGKKFLQTLNGTVGVNTPLINVNEISQLEIFKFIDGHVNLAANVGGISFLNYYLKDIPWLNLGGGTGRIRSNIVVKKGEVESKSKVEIETTNLIAHLWNQTAYGSGIVSWGLIRRDLGRVAVEFADYELRPPSFIEGKIQGKNLKITAESPTLDLTKPLKNISVILELPEAQITNLSYLNSYFPKVSLLKVKGGKGTLRANLRVFSGGNKKDSGEVFANGTDVSVEYKNLKYRGNIKLKGIISQSHLGLGLLNVPESEIQLSHFQDWSGSIKISNAKLFYGSDPTISANILLESSNAKPIVELFLVSQDISIPGWTETLLSFNNLILNFGMDIGKNGLALRQVHATGTGTDLKGWLKSTRGDRIGRWLLEYGPLAAGIELEGKTSHLKLNDAIGWYHGNGTKVVAE